MLNQTPDLNDAHESPGLCPEHGLPMDRVRTWWSTCTVLLCPLCDKYVRAKRAWLDDVVLPVVDDPDAAMRALVILFNDPRI